MQIEEREREDEAALLGGRKYAAAGTPLREANSTSGENALLPAILSPHTTQIFALFLIGLFIVCVLAAIFVRFPETVKSPFVLVPEQGANPVTSSRRGIVQVVNVRDGSIVKKGDVLFIVRSDELRVMAAERAVLERETSANRERVREMQNEARAQKMADEASRAEHVARSARLENECNKFKLQDSAISERHAISLQSAKSRLNSVRAEVKIEEKRIEIATQLNLRVTDAFKKGVTPEWDALRQQYSFEESKLAMAQAKIRESEAEAEVQRVEAASRLEINERALSLARLEGELAETRAAVERQVRAAEAQRLVSMDYSRQLMSQIAKSEVQLESLGTELKGTEEAQFQIVAPFDGAVIRVGPQRSGFVIERGQIMCELAQAGAKLQAEIAIPEKEAGRVRAEQRVRLLYSAFPYTRYGAKDARLVWISPAAQDGVFRARAELTSTEMLVDGRVRELSAGMGGEARIDTGRRTLMEFAFEPLRQLRENAAQ